jgi:sigma-B regulation protein RsbU (phosphoserine phosphatase)
MPQLHVIDGPVKGQTFTIEGDTVFIGRSPRNDIQINDNTISRKQLKIFRVGRNYFAEDLKSTNGTLINGEPAVAGEGVGLADGDVISIGSTLIRIADVPANKGLGLEVLRADNTKGSQDTSRSQDEKRSRFPSSLELICRASELVGKSLNFDHFMEEVTGLLLEALPRIDRAAILILDDRNGDIMQTFFRSREQHAGGTQPFSQSVVKRVFKDRKPLRMSDTTYESTDDFSDNMGTLAIRSVLCVPMMSNSAMRGVIYVDSIHGPYGFRKEDMMLLNSLSGILALATESALISSRSRRGAPG